MSSTKTRGAPMFYKDEVLYFQPNGTSCYLYENLDDVGHPEKSKYAPSVDAVRVPTTPEMIRFEDQQKAKRALLPEEERHDFRPSLHPKVPLLPGELLEAPTETSPLIPLPKTLEYSGDSDGEGTIAELDLEETLEVLTNELKALDKNIEKLQHLIDDTNAALSDFKKRARVVAKIRDEKMEAMDVLFREKNRKK